MDPFNTHQGRVAKLDRANVDTDAIIPKQFLKSIRRTGFGPFLFDDWRYTDPGELDTDPATRAKNADFVLNQPGMDSASILLTRKNFGCGSSREHAVWALRDYGFRVVIAPSYADIFFNNCFKNGVLPMVLPEADVDRLFDLGSDGLELAIDLPAQTLRGPGGLELSFAIDAHRKHCLVEGLDDIALTLAHADEIRAFEERHRQARPWLFQ